jgi:hypothetical protein
VFRGNSKLNTPGFGRDNDRIGALPAGLIRAARAIVVGAKAVTRPKPVAQPTRFCLSTYRGTAATLGFALPAHDVIE